ncbi:AAA family ATPase [Luteibacter sp. 3190]|uniref:AAA family ATPase n=1 Tax=Luteibacter sp. 3190 TaxID=2817736 RepID=UPI00285B8F75|nr:AAA family ATPase [Luteibacter sp. 3190]MDR6936007.1 wobble nucleotide-excising tRNase [Luteibacter sp. 3190]
MSVPTGNRVIRSIQRLRGFGVFDDFRKTNDIPEFAAKNIIYGWNYSGKTTLSRLFASLGSGVPYADCPGAPFEVRMEGGISVTETTLSPPKVTVEVFNTDFVSTNLSWSGEDFESILLLGDESIEAQERIERLNLLRGKRRQQLAATRNAVKDANQTISEAKTAAAKQIKTTLQIVEAFGATQLTTAIAQLSANATAAILPPESFAAELKVALTSDSERPRSAPALTTPTFRLARWQSEAGTLLAQVPAVSAVIQHLRDHPAIAVWVGEGLPLHAGQQNCEFCGGPFTQDRLRLLQGHFSKALTEQKDQLAALSRNIRLAALPTATGLDASRLLPEHQAAASRVEQRLQTLIKAYNKDLLSLDAAVQRKLERPFEVQDLPALEPSLAPSLAQAFAEATDLIASNNETVGNFKDTRGDALRRAKAHLVATFACDATLATVKAKIEQLNKADACILASGTRIKSTVDALQASINRAQHGRETLNERIALLLGTDAVQIEVVSVEGVDRFALRRHGQPARNLSDGERTAIAFAYFLTKLKEHKSLDEVIVYIDDPISSLDSNHVFQVYATLKHLFFQKVNDAHGKPKWVTACKQLFISTHNFEFFEMLKKLPIDRQKPTQTDGARYYLVKRIGPKNSTLVDLPAALRQYTSEYHYLFSVIYAFSEHPTKDDLEQLLALPNALRRFVELYTYMRLPMADTNVETRLGVLVGPESAVRVTQLLHHFSHLETVDRVASHTQLVAAIGPVVDELIELLREDAPHFSALIAAVQPANAAGGP